MAAPRRRSTSQGFSSTEGEQQTTETPPKEETSEQTSREMFETFSHIVEEHSQTLEEIVPTEAPGARFMEVTEPSPAPTVTLAPQPVAPKRHPRNIPKFSRTK